MTAPSARLGPLGTVTCVSGDVFCVSGTSGQVRPGGDQGFYVADVRVLDTLVVRVDGAEPQPLRGHATGADVARFNAYVPSEVPDPQLLVERRREVGGSLVELVRIDNYAVTPRTLRLEVEVGSDFAYIFDVRHARARPSAAAAPLPDGVRLGDPGDAACAEIRTTPPPDAVAGAVLRWEVTVPAHGAWSLRCRVSGGTRDADGMVVRGDEDAAEALPDRPGVSCSDVRFTTLLHQSAADLGSLLLPDPDAPADRFFAAGSPWYLTLFGRDALWAARMALPLAPRVAAETLRVLARRQGQRHDVDTEEAPGKILHEVRRGALSARADLPPVYYGTMDATPLFVSLAADAWRWGVPEAEIAALLPAVERALAWLRADGDADGDGFLEYRRPGGRGLVNQGWKDSTDGVQFTDGRLAEAPIALCEVQGYAYRAALDGAALLDHFGRDGGEGWRRWAADLADRFRAAYWVEDADGPFPAIALDRDKRPVDSLTSNIGHLLATGILDAEECALVARRLAGPDLDCGWGLRTLSTAAVRFNPFSYHGGSVWPHDTAIAVEGLAVTGHAEAAARLLHGLVAAARWFAFRLPELYAGDRRHADTVPLPYPAACLPQAWSAGAAWLVLRAVLGVAPDVPRGRVTVRPLWPPPFPSLRVTGLRLGDAVLDVAVDARDGVDVQVRGGSLAVHVVDGR